MFNHSHIRHFSSVFVSLRDFELITQNSSENIASRQSRCIYVNGLEPISIITDTKILAVINSYNYSLLPSTTVFTPINDTRSF